MFCSSGLDRFCSFNQSDPCYAALGHKLNLLMVLDASEYDLKIHKRINNDIDDPVCRVKNGRMRMSQCDLYNNRPEVTVINGILIIINHVIRADSGNYRLILTDHSWTTVTSRDLQVIVEGTETLSSDSLQLISIQFIFKDLTLVQINRFNLCECFYCSSLLNVWKNLVKFICTFHVLRLFSK